MGIGCCGYCCIFVIIALIIAYIIFDVFDFEKVFLYPDENIYRKN